MIGSLAERRIQGFINCHLTERSNKICFFGPGSAQKNILNSNIKSKRRKENTTVPDQSLLVPEIVPVVVKQNHLITNNPFNAELAV